MFAAQQQIPAVMASHEKWKIFLCSRMRMEKELNSNVASRGLCACCG